MAINLNGSSQYLTAPVDSGLEFGTGDFTVSFNVYIRSLEAGKRYASISLGTGSNGNSSFGSNFVSCAWCLYVYSSQIDFIRNDTVGTTSISRSFTFTLNTWQRVTVRRSGTAVSILVGSTQVGATATSSASLNRIASGGSQDLHIGRLFTGNGAETPISGTNYYVSFMDGLVSEVGIWKGAALTDAEIASLAAGFTPDQIRPQSLQFYAPLVNNLNDVCGGRAITNNNGATVATHPRVYT